MRDRIEFREGDGLTTIRELSDRPDVVFFIDPPYTAGRKRAGKRLYVHSELDHAELFRLASGIAGDFLMTYDDAPELRTMAARHHFDTLLVSMRNTHLTQMQELLIGRDLRWARDRTDGQLRLLDEQEEYTST